MEVCRSPVYRNSLENCRAPKGHRGFESHRFRQMHKYPYQHPRNYDYVSALIDQEFAWFLKKYGRTSARMIKTGENTRTNIYLIAATMKVMECSVKEAIDLHWGR